MQKTARAGQWSGRQDEAEVQHQQAVLEDKDGNVHQIILSYSHAIKIRSKSTQQWDSDVYLESLLARRLPYVFEGLVVFKEVLATSDVHLEERHGETGRHRLQLSGAGVKLDFQVFRFKNLL